MSKMFAILIAMLSGALLAAQETKPLPAPASPGQAIQDSAQASVHDRPRTGNVEILSDTKGVIFGPYLQEVVSRVRRNWHDLIPADEVTKKGKLAIEFAIQKDGRITAMKLADSSGDVSLDRAAWGGITASNPLPALPGAFTGPYLTLRFHFYYNPSASDLAGDKASPAIADSVVHAVLMQKTADSHRPKYPKKARSAKIEGTVRLEGAVDVKGKVGDIKVLEGDPTLAEASIGAIREWRFHPAQISGKPVEERVRIKVEFYLEGQQVRAEVVWPEAAPSQNLSH